MQEYRLPTSLMVFIYSLLTVLTLGGLGGIILGFTVSRSGPPAWFAGLWVGVMGYVWYAYLRLPYKITRLADGSLEFHSFLRQLTLMPREIVEVRGVFLSPGFLRLRHTEGSLWLLARMTGLQELIAWLRQANPDLVVAGI